MNRPAAWPVTVAVVAGMALWFVASFVSGKREAWDATVYWVVAYPVAIIVSALLGYLYPLRPWRWALALFEAQLLAMCIRNGELGSLWPLGMLMFAVIALPAMLVANLASRRSPLFQEEPSQ